MAGISPARIENDWKLINDLGGDAMKVVVVTRSPAWRAGLRTGDYLISASPSATTELAPAALLELPLPLGTEIFLRAFRPQTRQTMESTAILGAVPGQPVPKWRTCPACAAGERVLKKGRPQFRAEMAGNPRIKGAAFKLLVLLMDKYDNDQCGAFPSYDTIAGEFGVSRRRVMSLVNQLEHAGVLRVLRRQDGAIHKTNVFQRCWPVGWRRNVSMMPRSSAGIRPSPR
jgi:hypothetical protein